MLEAYQIGLCVAGVVIAMVLFIFTAFVMEEGDDEERAALGKAWLASPFVVALWPLAPFFIGGALVYFNTEPRLPRAERKQLKKEKVRIEFEKKVKQLEREAGL